MLLKLNTKRSFRLAKFLVAFLILSFVVSPFASVVGFPEMQNAEAAINKQINYQGKLTNSSSVVVPNGSYNMRFKLYTQAVGGTAIWTETLSGTNRPTLASGLFSIMLGSTTAFTSIDFNQTLYLGVEIGGSDVVAVWDGEMSPRKVLGAVPAAMVAENANTIQGLNPTQFVRSDSANSTSTASTYLSLTQTGAGNILDIFGAGSALVATFGSNGNVGIGTTSPYAKLSVVGEVVASHFTATTTATSTFAGGFQTNLLNVTSATASSTFANGLNLSAGCFAVNGACVQSAAGIVSSQWTSVAGGINYAGGNVGIGTTTPWGKLSVNPDGITGPAFVIGSSTATKFIVTNAGNVGIGSSSPLGKLSVDSDLVIPMVTMSSRYNVQSNIRVSGDEILAVDGELTNAYAYYAKVSTGPYGVITNGYGLYLDSIAGENNSYGIYQSDSSNKNYFAGNLGIGTTSPYAKLSVQATAGQANPVFEVASSSNTVKFLSVSGIGFGTTTVTGLSINGSATSTSNVGLNLSAGCFAVNGACVQSAAGIVSSQWTSVAGGINYAGGNVGIGTTSPYAKLSVAGDVVSSRFISTSTLQSVFAGGLTAGVNGISQGLHVANNGNTEVYGTFKVTAYTSNRLSVTGDYYDNNYLFDAGGTIPMVGTGIHFSINQAQNKFTFLGGSVGIGTFSPYSKLSVWGGATGNIFEAVTSASSTALSVSGTGFGTTTVTGLSINGSATSTSNVGLNITSGCFAMNGNCLERGSVSSVDASGGTTGLTFTGGPITNTGVLTLAGTLSVANGGTGWANINSGYIPFGNGASALATSTNFFWDNTNSRLGIGTTSPWAKLSVGSASADATTPLFVVASSSNATLFNVLANGNVGVGTANPSAKFAVVGDSIFEGNVATPTHKGSLADGVGSAALLSPSAVQVVGNYAYVASRDSNALEIVDISNPAALVHKGSVANGAGGAVLSQPTDVFVAGNYAYVVSIGSDALEIVDISNPALPVHKGSLANGAGGAAILNPYGVFVSGNYAYVASYGSNALEIIDISNPAAPAHKGSATGITGAIDVYVVGNLAYVAASTGDAIQIIDVSNPAAPVQKGSLAHGAGGAVLDYPRSIVVSGSYAYVASYDSNALEIVNVSNPAAPAHAGSLANGAGGALLEGAGFLAVAGNYAYIASYTSNALEIVDISNPAAPTHKGSIVDGSGGAALSTPTSIAVSGNYAYLTSYGGNAIEIIDISGVTISNAKIGSAIIDTLQVSNRAIFNQDLSVFSSLNVGRDTLIGGTLTVSNTGTTTGTSNSVAAKFLNGSVAIGTTSPYARLSVWGGATGNIFEAVTSASSTALSVSGTGFGTTTVTGLNINGSATSTSNVGLNLSAGCFAVNGTCVQSAAGIVSSQWTSATGGINYAGGNVGIGTTSPWGQLSINPNGITGPAFVIGSSTATSFIVTNAGNVGIGTAAPTNLLSVVNANGIIADFRKSSSNFLTLNSTGAFAEIQSDNGTLPVLSIKGTGVADILAVFDNTIRVFTVKDGGNVGIGTTTVPAKLTIAGSGTETLLKISTTTGNPVLSVVNNEVIIGSPIWTPTTANEDTYTGLGQLTSYGDVVFPFLGSLAQNNRRIFVGHAGNDMNGISLSISAGAGGNADNEVGGIGGSLFLNGGESGNFPTMSHGNVVLANLWGNVAIGTTSPYAKLSVWGGATGNIFEAVTSASSTALSVSGTGFGTTTVTGLSINGSATSTSNVGLNLSAGCFAVNGICVQSAAGLVSSQWASATGGINYAGGNVGIGTTSPASVLHINSSATVPSLRITGRAIDNSVDNTAGIFFGMNHNSSGNRQIVFGDTDVVGSNTLGMFRMTGSTALPAIDAITGNGINRLNVNIGTPTTNVGIGFEFNGSTGATLPSSRLTVNGGASVGSGYIGITAPTDGLLVQGNLGIGTTSPWAKLSIAGSAGGTSPLFAISTSTAGFATSTAFFIDSNGLVGVGTTTLASTAKMTIDGALSITSSNGAVIIGDTSGNARGALSLDIQSARNSASQVASSAEGSIAIGMYNTASGGSGGSIAIGRGNVASNLNGSSAIGQGNTAANWYSFGSSYWNPSFAFGGSNNAREAGSLAFGGSNNALNLFSSAFGYLNLASGAYSSAFGASTTASAAYSSAFGYGLINNVASSTMIGPNNLSKLTILGATGSEGFVGIGTTSPWAKLSINAEAGITPFAIGSSTGQIFLINSYGSTTASNGFNITAGCYAVNGACIQSAAGIVSSQWASATGGINYAGGNVGIGTTSPFAKFAIHALNGETNSLLFAIASSTATGTTTLFSIDNSGVMTIGSDETAGDTMLQLGSDANAWSLGYFSSDKSFRIASSTSLNSNTAFNISKGGNIGIGTTSPYAKLSVVGQVVASYFTATTTATSTFAGGFQTNLLNVTSATASSTFANGLNLSAGCFAVNGACVQSAAGIVSSQWASATGGINYAGGNVGIGTTSPWAKLSVWGAGTGANRLFELTNSASTSLMYVLENGSINFPVATATSTFAGGLDVGNGALKYDLSTGITSISSAEIGAMSFEEDAGAVSWMDLPISSSANNTVQSYTAHLNGEAVLTVFGQSNGAGGIKNTAVGIGTTSPYEKLSVVGGVVASYFNATTTATSTFAGGFAANALNITSMTATSTFANGINISDGCFAIDGACIQSAEGIVSSQWASVAGGINYAGGKVGIGTANPRRALDVYDVANPQMRLSQTDNSVYTDFKVAASTGDLTISLYPNTTAENIYLNQPDGTTGANLWVCQGTACPTDYLSLTNGGNIVVENSYYFGNGFRISTVDASTTAVYDTTNTIIMQFDEVQ